MKLLKIKPGSIASGVLRSLFKKPATKGNIGDKVSVDIRSRGLIQYSPENCVACGLCMRDCPTGAIQVVNMGTKEQKDMHAFLNTGKCIYCGQCGDSCAKKCISFSSEVDLAMFARNDLTVEL